jgi:peptidoglycan/LPS O-acetylase OafA/YrhL
MKKYFTVLDSFRGICACIVALSHFNANSIINGSALLDRGSPYVDFFFVLSGFIIFANYQDKLKQGTKIWEFIWLRWGRLYPLHFAVLLAFILVDVLQMMFDFGQSAAFAPFGAPGETPRAIFAMLFLVHSLGLTEILAFNGPSWSISVEFYAYILFAFIIVYIRKHTELFIAFLSCACGLALYFVAGELYAKLDYGFLRCVFGFGFGALTWSLYRLIAPTLEQKAKNWKFTSLLEALILLVTCIYIAYFSFNGLSFFAPLIFSIVILVFAIEGGLLSKMLKMKAFVFIGMLSYSIYMVHLFISGKFFELPVRLLENSMGYSLTVQQGDMTLYGTNIIYGTLLEVFYLSFVILCSFISYKLIEEPFRNLSKKVIKRKKKKVT